MTYLVPPIAVVLGWIILGEVPPLLALPGGALCLAGVALARAHPERESAAAGASGRIAISTTVIAHSPPSSSRHCTSQSQFDSPRCPATRSRVDARRAAARCRRVVGHSHHEPALLVDGDPRAA